MSLLERVTTLLRANVNDLIDKAEDPEKLMKQLLLDMENQLMQVKTQVAIAVADRQLLEKQKKEHDDAVESWQNKAELALNKGHDDMARTALDRSLSHRQIAAGFAQQIDDQASEAELMRLNYGKLQQKLRETTAQCEMLLARQRRARTANRAHHASVKAQPNTLDHAMQRMKLKAMQSEAESAAARLLEQDELISGAVEENFRRLEREDQIEALLEELKSRKALPPQPEMKALKSE